MERAPRNRTITLSDQERADYRRRLLKIANPVSVNAILNRIINQDLHHILNWLPSRFVDLLFLDPPYNLTKDFNTYSFKQQSVEGYMEWLDSWLPKMIRTLKPGASVYICGDWRSSTAIQLVCDKYLIVRNRITFEREKGRGAKKNWKNNSEDIWFCTVSNDYYFDADVVRLKRRGNRPLSGRWESQRIGQKRQMETFDSLPPQTSGQTSLFRSGQCLKTRPIRRKNLKKLSSETDSCKFKKRRYRFRSLCGERNGGGCGKEIRNEILS